MRTDVVLVADVENGAEICGGAAIAATGRWRRLLNAIDVAVLIDSQRRPHRLGNGQGFPDRALKPGDATYPPFLGPFSPSQHLTGPWQPIRQWQKDNAQTLRRDSPAPVR